MGLHNSAVLCQTVVGIQLSVLCSVFMPPPKNNKICRELSAKLLEEPDLLKVTVTGDGAVESV